MTLATKTQNTNVTTCSKLSGLGGLAKVWSQRQTLNRLDDRALNDIGLTRAEAEAEARRSIWDVPDTWRIWGASETWRIWGASETREN